MKIVFVCGLIVALAQFISAAQICDYDVTYTSVFVPDCTGNDILIDWPYYQDFTKYYSCTGFNTPILNNCPKGKYFSYFLQQCTDCGRFLPPPECQNLKTDGTPKCVASGTTSTPAPVTKTTPALATKSTTIGTASTKTTKKPVIVPTPPAEPPTPATADPSAPTPPLLPTSAPGIPTPPVEPPTPPNLDVTPPSAD